MGDTNDWVDDAGATRGDRREFARYALEANWLDGVGHSVPNVDSYPHLWLWDSSFHSLAWLTIDPDRAISELGAAMSGQLASGFVPHMVYRSETLRRGPLHDRSSFTQPPVYAIAAAELSVRGLAGSGPLLDQAVAAVEWLLKSRIASSGLVYVVHPWETGVDDSPRWDAWAGAEWDYSSQVAMDAQALSSAEFDDGGAAIDSSFFKVCSIGFNAILALGIRALVNAGVDRLSGPLDELVDAIDGTFDPEDEVFVDEVLTAGVDPIGPDSSREPTLDSYLALLVTRRMDVLQRGVKRLVDPEMFLADMGLRFLPRTSPKYLPDIYWRGVTWPQLDYLFVRGLLDLGYESEAKEVLRRSRAGAVRSGMAEYWNPESASSMGAAPQAWTAVLMTDVEEPSTGFGLLR